MAAFLVCYGTGVDRAAAVADRFVDVVEGRGHEATSVRAGVFPSNVVIEGFDAIVVVAGGDSDARRPAVSEFVRSNLTAMADRPTAVLCVDPATATPQETATDLDAFLATTGWNPDRIARFGGSLDFATYGFLDRLLVKLVAAGAGGDAIAASEDGASGTDPSGSTDGAEQAGRVDRTEPGTHASETKESAEANAGGTETPADDDGDWPAVENCAADVAAFVEGRRGAPAAGPDAAPGDE